MITLFTFGLAVSSLVLSLRNRAKIKRFRRCDRSHCAATVQAHLRGIGAVLLLVGCGSTNETTINNYGISTGGSTFERLASVTGGTLGTGGSTATGGAAATGGMLSTGGNCSVGMRSNPQLDDTGVTAQCQDPNNPQAAGLLEYYAPNGVGFCDGCHLWCRIGILADGSASGNKWGTCWSCPGALSNDHLYCDGVLQ